MGDLIPPIPLKAAEPFTGLRRLFLTRDSKSDLRVLLSRSSGVQAAVSPGGMRPFHRFSSRSMPPPAFYDILRRLFHDGSLGKIATVTRDACLGGHPPLQRAYRPRRRRRIMPSSATPASRADEGSGTTDRVILSK